MENPTYRQVCTGRTGHAEAVQLVFDPDVVTYDQLLEVFWAMHDPTQMDRQGPDVGTQYRSVILAHSPEQRAAAERSKTEAQMRFDRPIATEIADFVAFFPAEDYHQHYYERSGHRALLSRAPRRAPRGARLRSVSHDSRPPCASCRTRGWHRDSPHRHERGPGRAAVAPDRRT